MRAVRCTLLAACASLLTGCAAPLEGVGYYWQSVSGHLALMHSAQPIAELLRDPTLDPTLRGKLELAREVREFASAQLGLPDNGSYRSYARIGRPFVVWNVFAAPELSLRLEQGCFPVAGCVSYRGYFSREDAERYAQRLRARGLETQVAGVPAYSTLGFFDDPLPDTVTRYPDAEIARLIFHELSHQVLYVKGDSRFNESFATAVQEVGVERWLAANELRTGNARVRRAYEEFAGRRREFLALLLRHREELERIYESDVPDSTKRAAKAAVFAALEHEYAALRARWGGFAGYDHWFAGGVTNAHLAAVAAYTELVPGFLRVLAEQGGSLPRFYAAARALSTLSRVERDARLETAAPPGK